MGARPAARGGTPAGMAPATGPRYKGRIDAAQDAMSSAPLSSDPVSDIADPPPAPSGGPCRR